VTFSTQGWAAATHNSAQWASSCYNIPHQDVGHQWNWAQCLYWSHSSQDSRRGSVYLTHMYFKLNL